MSIFAVDCDGQKGKKKSRRRKEGKTELVPSAAAVAHVACRAYQHTKNERALCPVRKTEKD